jgi:protein transport protein SEC61 subunit gamma-like protein
VSRKAGKGGRVKNLLLSWKKIIKLSRRPEKDEFNLLLKLNFLGFTLVGGIAYIIHIMATVIIPSIVK